MVWIKPFFIVSNPCWVGMLGHIDMHLVAVVQCFLVCVESSNCLLAKLDMDVELAVVDHPSIVTVVSVQLRCCLPWIVLSMVSCAPWAMHERVVVVSWEVGEPRLLFPVTIEKQSDFPNIFLPSDNLLVAHHSLQGVEPTGSLRPRGLAWPATAGH